MGLITEEIEVKLNSNMINYYQQLGYNIQKTKDKWGRYTIPVGTKIFIKIKDLPKNSNIYIKVKCDCCGKEKEIQYIWYLNCVHDDGKYYCRKCGHKLFAGEKVRITRLKNGKSFEQWCIENNRQDVLDRWDYELNNCKPSEIGFSTNKKYYFKCSKNIHPSELKNINCFTNGKKGSINCKACDSFAQWGIDNICSDFLEKYWDYEKNKDIDSWNISYGTDNIKVWIKCQNKDKTYHDSYNITPSSFIRGSRCPYCSNHKVHPLDSLGKLLEDRNLLNIWSDKNKKSPYEYAPNSNQKVWWKCMNKHEDYYRSIINSNNYDFRCPECTRERDESFLQEKVRLYLEGFGNSKYTTLHEKNCSLNPKNIINSPSKRKTFKLRYDNEIIINNKHLFVEVMGQQHGFITFYTKLQAEHYNTTPEQELNYQIAKDKYKEQYVYQQGKNYYYLAVWYYDFDNNNTYKQLIDNKIKEILDNK